MSKTSKQKNKSVAKPKMVVILGPTAVGKSDVAVKIAKKFKGEIISADSRQVYKGLDIGTGKITKREMSGVPHHLLDVASPTSSKRFTVDIFQKLTYLAADEILSRGKLPILCGGTGFYIQAIVDGVVLPDVQIDPALRKKLNQKSGAQLVKILSKLDKKRLKAIDPRNKVRLIRAIEIAMSLGKVPVLKKEPRFDTLQIGLDIDSETLKDKIKKRIENRMKKGMVTEAKKLHRAGLSYKRMREFGLEYKHLADLLEKKNPNKTVKAALANFSFHLAAAIWHYAKRQRQWFGNDKRILWHKPSDLKKIEKAVSDFI